MDPFSIAAASSAASSIASSALSYSNAEQNRSHQLGMDNTKYQRGVKDLKAAGLNPILAAGGMTGNMGAGSSMPAPENPALSAANAKLLAKQADLIDSQADLNSAKATAARAGAGLSSTKTDALATVAEVSRFIKGWLNQNQSDPEKLGRELSKQFGKDVTKTLPDAMKRIQSTNSSKVQGNMDGFINQVIKWVNKAYWPLVDQYKHNRSK